MDYRARKIRRLDRALAMTGSYARTVSDLRVMQAVYQLINSGKPVDAWELVNTEFSEGKVTQQDLERIQQLLEAKS